jgi:hypothetical protein
MSSLFDQLSGFEFPDVLMNSGPLPSTAGGPAGSDGSVDGVINGTNALLENISPYAFGKSARTGSDRNYQQIPHRFQYIIPRLYIPHFDTERRIHISHSVDQGDIAFLLYGGERAWLTTDKQFGTRAPQCAFATIEVVNYILLCMQASQTKDWKLIREDLIKHTEFEKAMKRRTKQEYEPFDDLKIFKAIRLLVQQVFVPHGICAGSEHQGGQHEHTGGHPVQAAVNFVTTMTVDGKNVDLVNYWYGLSMIAGDELIFRLEKQEIKESKEFHLSRYYKEPVSVSVNPYTRVNPNIPATYIDRSYWQLVPDIMRKAPIQTDAPFDEKHWWCDHRCEGYWRIAQTFQTRMQNNSSNAFTRGLPLEVTFAPVFQSFLDCEYDRVEHPEFTHYVDHYDDTKFLEATFTQDKLSWKYEDKAAFSVEVKNNGYVLWSDKKICRVYFKFQPVTTPYHVKSLENIICFFAENVEDVNQEIEVSGSALIPMQLSSANNVKGQITYESKSIQKDLGTTNPDFYLRINFDETKKRSFMDVDRNQDLFLFDTNLWIEKDKNYKVREKLAVDYIMTRVPQSNQAKDPQGSQGGQVKKNNAPPSGNSGQGEGLNFGGIRRKTEAPKLHEDPPEGGGEAGDSDAEDSTGAAGGGIADAPEEGNLVSSVNIDPSAVGPADMMKMTTNAVPTAAAFGLLPAAQKKRRTLKIFDDIL